MNTSKAPLRYSELLPDPNPSAVTEKIIRWSQGIYRKGEEETAEPKPQFQRKLVLAMGRFNTFIHSFVHSFKPFL